MRNDRNQKPRRARADRPERNGSTPLRLTDERLAPQRVTPRPDAEPADAARVAEEGGWTGESLATYLRSIRDIPVLSKQETFELAAALEEHELAFREAMFAIPGTALQVLATWYERQERGLVTAVLSAHYPDPGGRDWSRQIDTALRRLETLVQRREGLRGASPEERRRVDREIRNRLRRAELSFSLLHSIYLGFEKLTGERGSRADTALRRRLGLHTQAGRAELARARKAIEQRDEVKQTFVSHNLKLVVTCAKRYRNMGVPFMDLIQEGNLGLIRAVEKFDRHRGHRFSTYAVWWIEQSLIRSIQNQSRTVRVPSHMYDLQLRHRRVRQELRTRLRRDPTREELAEALSLTRPELNQLEATMKPIESIHAQVPGTDDLTLEDALPDRQVEHPIEEVDREEVHKELDRMLQVLSPREREILEWRFGLRGTSPATLQEIGERIGLSRERVRQLEVRALKRLREQEGAADLAASLELAGEAA